MVNAASTEKTGAKDAVVYDVSLLTDGDVYLFNAGSHFDLYNKLGAHPMVREGMAGTHFSVWAPNAEKVSVMGAFNGWDNAGHILRPRGSSGIW